MTDTGPGSEFFQQTVVITEFPFVLAIGLLRVFGSQYREYISTVRILIATDNIHGTWRQLERDALIGLASVVDQVPIDLQFTLSHRS